MTIKNIDVQTAKQWLDKNEAILIDVREPAEHASQKITGAALHPVSSICCSAIPQTDKKILIHCQKGMRGSNACQKLLAENDSLEVYNVEGGIEAWQQAGFNVETSSKKILPLDRQVQLAIGLMLITGSLLGYIFSPAWFMLTGFIGAGLTIAGLTGFCGLAMVMAKMPWNQSSGR